MRQCHRADISIYQINDCSPPRCSQRYRCCCFGSVGASDVGSTHDTTPTDYMRKRKGDTITARNSPLSCCFKRTISNGISGKTVHTGTLIIRSIPQQNCSCHNEFHHHDLQTRPDRTHAASEVPQKKFTTSIIELTIMYIARRSRLPQQIQYLSMCVC